MTVVDTHVHVWTQGSRYPWADAPGILPMAEARPERLLGLMDAAGVDRAVLVQYIGYRWDNRYVADILAAQRQSRGVSGSCPAGSRFAGVCRVDPEDPDAPDHLAYWTETHGFHGVRLSPSVDADGDWFEGPLMVPLFLRAADLGVPVLLLTGPGRLPDLRAILERVPDVDVVLDHMADCVDGDEAHMRALLDLARYPRVYLKLSHLWVHSTEGYPWRDTHARLARVRDVFGADRILWGSDWPMCIRCATYGQALSYLRDDTPVFSAEELAWLFGGTAQRLWRFD